MHGLIAWFARNAVAANLLMVFIIAWGLSALFTRIPLEVFPGFELDTITISVPFRGASPEEVETGVTIRVEETIQDISGIRQMTSTAAEGLGTIVVEVANGVAPRDVQNDIEQRLDGIAFPEEAGTPSTRIPEVNREVISVVVAGDLPERELRQLATRVRDELEMLPNVSDVAVSGVRDYELAIEIGQYELERYALTLAQIVDAVALSSIDLAAGALTTGTGDVLLRARGQAMSADDYADIVIRAENDGSVLRLGDIARINDGFEETELAQYYNGQRSIEISVYRSGLQSAITVADEVKAYLQEAQLRMPYGVTLGYWRDWSRVVKARVKTLTDSALQGGILIVLLLSLFLRFWVAVWVFVGVPVSILGGLAMMSVFGVSLNLLTLFAFILVLGIVVDDAIVTGENIYTHMRRDGGGVQAAINGTNEVAVPVTFGVLTTVAAFTPLLMIEGARGQVFAQIPLVVIPVLLFSIIESKFVLPAHMSHLRFSDQPLAGRGWAYWQNRLADGFEAFVRHRYQPLLAWCLKNRYLVLSAFLATAVVIFALVSSGQIRFVFFPRVQSETARFSLEMPAGTPFEATQAHIQKATEAAQQLQAHYIDPDSQRSVVESIISTTGSRFGERGSHLGRVMFEIAPPEERNLDVSSRELLDEWRGLIGEIPGARNQSFSAEIGGGGSPLDVEIAGNDLAQMNTVLARIREQLSQYPGVRDISDTFEGGKEEIQLSLTAEGRRLGLTLADLARQVRVAYLGEEVQSLQRGRDEVRVMVRYPQADRVSLSQLESMPVRTPSGSTVPLSSVADLVTGRGYAQILRVDRQRTLNVRADVDKETTNTEGIKDDLTALADSLQQQYPDIRISLEGEAREQRESFASLRTGLVFVLLVIYTLLAIPFKSYVQPLLVMVVIPFGVVGGVFGHMIMGMPLSIMSYMGMLALCGVVVNDSLVLVDWINRQRRQGMALLDAVRTAGVARFRAVVLTSLTTFFGLLPLIFETSTQAQFLIPMAVSLGYGILFATLVTLILIPVNYLVLEDIRRVFRAGLSRLIKQRALPEAG